MAHDKGHFEIEDRGAILIVRVDGGPHALFGPEVANQLEELVDRVDHDSSVHAVVFTGAHSERFISHADVRWLQEGARPLLRSGDTALPQSYARPKSVDELVPQDKVVSRAAERAEYFGSRPKGAIAAIKRSVYFGGSMSLSEGLHV